MTNTPRCEILLMQIPANITSANAIKHIAMEKTALYPACHVELSFQELLNKGMQVAEAVFRMADGHTVIPCHNWFAVNSISAPHFLWRVSFYDSSLNRFTIRMLKYIFNKLHVAPHLHWLDSLAKRKGKMVARS